VEGVADKSFLGGYNFKVPGTFNGKEGVFELGINPGNRVIYHYLFRSK